MNANGFRVVGDLPDKVPGSSQGTTFQKRAIAFLIQNPNQWVEVARRPKVSPTGNQDTYVYLAAKRLREFGIDVEIRADGDQRVIFARLTPGGTQ